MGGGGERAAADSKPPGISFIIDTGIVASSNTVVSSKLHNPVSDTQNLSILIMDSSNSEVARRGVLGRKEYPSKRPP